MINCIGTWGCTTKSNSTNTRSWCNFQDIIQYNIFFSALQKISFKISYEGRIKSRPSNRFYNSEFNNNQSNKKPMNLNWTHCKPIIKYVLIDFKYEKTSRSHLRPTSFFHPSSYKKIWLKRWWSWIWKRAQHRNKRSIVFSQ